MKYVLTTEIVETLEKLDDELSDAMMEITNIVNSDLVDDDDIDDLNWTMERVIEAWEDFKKVKKEEVEDGE